MKKTKKVIREIEVEIIEDIICNNCGNSCRAWRSKDDVEIHDAYGLIETKVSGGYDSTELCDMTSYSFSLCEPCLKQMFDAFKIPPTVFDHDNLRYDELGSVQTYDPNWKENSKKKHNEHQKKMHMFMETKIPSTPNGWVKNYDANGIVFSQQNKESPVSVSFTSFHDLAENASIHVSICRNHGETPISPEEIEEARRLFVPQIEFNEDLKAVRVMRTEKTNEIAVVGFSL